MREPGKVALLAFLIALLVITGTAAAFFYAEYRSESSAAAQYAKDLQTADAKFNETAQNYNTLLSQYNLSVSLLSKTVAMLNTSSPVYQQASTQLGALWKTYLALKPATSSLFVASILVDFGNGTRQWHNGTSAQPGWNLYVFTLVLTAGSMDAQWYPQYGEHFILGLYGIESNPAADRGWVFWTWNATAGWQNPPVGADQLDVHNGSVFAWTYCRYDPSTGAPLCRP